MRSIAASPSGSKAHKPADLGAALQASQRRVTNATRLLVGDPDDADIRKQRDSDKAEVARLQAAIAGQSREIPRKAPDARAIKAAIGTFLATITSEATGEAREALARCVGHVTLTPSGPKSTNPGLVGTGVCSLARVLANSSSGGRHSNANLRTWIDELFGWSCPSSDLEPLTSTRPDSVPSEFSLNSVL